MQQKKYGPITISPFNRDINVRPEKLQRSLSLLVLSACIVLLACSAGMGDTTVSSISTGAAEHDTAGVIVERSERDNATIYSISSGACTIKWIGRNSEIGVIKYWSQCELSLAEQIPLLAKICTEFFSSDKNAQAFRTLFWGTLEPDNRTGSRELSLRLALAAYRSPGWDLKQGKPKNGDINGFVKDLANRENIYPELKELFQRFQKKVTFSCVEKVLVQRAEKLPFFDQLKKKGVKAADRLPFDCMTWFSVTTVSQK